MKVRDKTKKPTEYKGHEVPAGAGGRDCPCLPCFNVHDCGYWNSAGKRVHIWHCATNWNHGCPDPLPRPTHIFKLTKRFQNRKPGDVFRCIRCGQRLKISGDSKFNFFAEK